MSVHPQGRATPALAAMIDASCIQSSLSLSLSLMTSSQVVSLSLMTSSHEAGSCTQQLRSALSPQQCTRPAPFTAQTVSQPAETLMTFDTSGSDGTGRAPAPGADYRI